jgi:branched-subunit amino acid aminotransferase/4-amino-4-deoxychorismate lyase
VSDYGCFTTFRVERDGVRGWEAHLERLVRDSGVLFDR